MEETIYKEVNSCNTPITEELFKGLDKKSRTDFLTFFNEIEFIRNLTSLDRQLAKDRPRDKKGRIIVDLENPHILENMSYFTERADFFRKNGRYTDIYPNPAPGSEYKRFWDEERRRCREGYVRESDGEWVTGYHYFYLNYGPILKVEEEEANLAMIAAEFIDEQFPEDTGVRAERIEDFPDIWDGDYLFYHYVERAETRGKHGTILKCRGRGYSFKGGNMLVRNYFIIKASRSYAFADETEYLTKDGILTKAWANVNFIDNHTPFTQPRDYKDTEMQKRASYKDTENKTEKGFMSEIIGVTCKNDVQKGRGKRGKLLFFDESGSFPGLKQIWGIARKSVEQGRYVYGFMVTAGTGGTQGADFEAAEAFFYQPDAYNILSMKNVFDLSNKGEGKSGLFIPEYLNRQGCYDKDGNSDVIKSMIEIMHQRQQIRVSSNDPNDIVREKAEAPITPQEAVLRMEGSLFPVQDLKDYLAEISVNLRKFTDSHYIGRIGLQGTKPIFVANDNLQPTREFPIKDNKDKEGAVELFELPIEFNGYIDPYRYIAGIDTYDDDHSTTNSLGSIFIFDRYTDRIVAEYTGRPNTANEFYEICLRLLKLYNAKANYENDKKGLYGYFYNKNALNYLCDNPEILAEKDLANIKNNYGNKKKGTNSGTAVNAWGRRLQADWLVENAYGTGGVDDEGNEIPPSLNLQRLRSIGYIRELIAWHPDINNADRVSAMGMLMILREDMKRLEVRAVGRKVKTIFDDPFFKRTNSNSYSMMN